MKAEEIVKAIVSRLPGLTDKFTQQASINTITSSGLLATATVLSGHGLASTQLITITGAISPVLVLSLNRTLTSAVVETVTDHDFTLNDREKSRGFTINAELSGFNESEFNGSFKILSVENRRKFTIQVPDLGPIAGTGAGSVDNGSGPLNGYNGSVNVTVLNSTQFTYQLQNAVPNDSIGLPVLHSGHRISAAVTIDRFIDAYTKQGTDELWLAVILGDVIASKGRENRSDSVDSYSQNTFYQQEITQPFGIYVVFPASSSIAGRSQRDDAEDIVPLILQSVLLEKFGTGFSGGAQNGVTFTAHGIFLYNGPLYVHEITFEQNTELIFDDSVGSDINVAFRDIDLNIGVDLGTEQDKLISAIDLDEEPL
jgi:hypothetical protein